MPSRCTGVGVPLDEAGHRAAAATRGTVPLVHGVAIARLIYLSCPKAQQTALPVAQGVRQSALLPGPIPFVRLLPGTAPFSALPGSAAPPARANRWVPQQAIAHPRSSLSVGGVEW